MAKDGSAIPVLLVAGGLFGLLYASGKMSKTAGAATVPGTPATVSGSSGGGSRSCGGCGGAPTAQVNVTTPVTPTAGRVARPGKSLSGVYSNGGQADHTPNAAPGSNSNAPGSGGNWQGLQTAAASTLTPASAPNSPSIPTGASILVASATPAYVSSGAS
jgi:hypothetical protein